MDTHLNNFNVLRLLAASQVVYMHSIAYLQAPGRGGVLFHLISQFPGVACFFVISGFLVTDSYLRSRSNGSFFLKRSLRIYPALAFNILVLDFAMWLTGGLFAIGDFARYLVYLAVTIASASPGLGQWASGLEAIYGQSTVFPTYPSDVLWTLTVELTFYLVLPVFLAILLKARTAGLALLAAAAAGSFLLAHTSNPAYYDNGPVLLMATTGPYFWIFAIGIFLRIFWNNVQKTFENRFLLWLAAYLIVTTASVQWGGQDSWLDYKFMPNAITAIRIMLMGGTVISFAYSFVWLSRNLRLGALDVSYSLYLFHMLVVYWLLGNGITKAWYVWLLVYGLSLAISLISWVVIERPALNLRSRIRKDTAETVVPSIDPAAPPLESAGRHWAASREGDHGGGLQPSGASGSPRPLLTRSE